MESGPQPRFSLTKKPVRGTNTFSTTITGAPFPRTFSEKTWVTLQGRSVTCHPIAFKARKCSSSQRKTFVFLICFFFPGARGRYLHWFLRLYPSGKPKAPLITKLPVGSKEPKSTMLDAAVCFEESLQSVKSPLFFFGSKRIPFLP